MAEDTRDPVPGETHLPRSRRTLRLTLFTALFIGVIVFVWALGDIFASVFAALALAYMLDPLVKGLERRGWPRRRAVIAIFVGSIVVIIALLGASVPFVVRDVSYAVSAVKANLKEDEQAAHADGAHASGSNGERPRGLRRSATIRRLLDWAEQQRLIDRTMVWLQENAKLVAEQTLSAARGGIKFLFRLGWFGFMVLLFPVYLYFFMVGLGEFKDKAFALVPPVWRPRAERIAHDFGVALSGFFRGRLVVALAIGVFTAGGFTLIGLRFGVLLGLAIGVSSLIPFVNIVFLVPAVLIAIVEFQSFGWTAAVFGVYAAGQGLDPLLTPYLMSRRTGLHPVTIIVSLLVWGRLLGVVGLLLAVPLTAAIKIVGGQIVVPALSGDGDHTGPAAPEGAA